METIQRVKRIFFFIDNYRNIANSINNIYLEIVSTELANGHEGKPFFKSIVALAKGDPERNIRARVGDTCEDVNEQVQCLIDLATDKSILGVAWSGWQSFM
jgi:DNA-dependent protein kinase catalytic subunit